MEKLNKESLLSKVRSYEILNRYLLPFHNKQILKQGENISNPFLTEKQKTPSFNIYVSLPSHEWRYKDFATGEDGSCFDLVMKLFHLDFSAALKKIAEDFGINYSQNDNIESKSYNIKRRDFTESELEFWTKYGITKEVLKKFNVSALSEYTFQSKDDKRLTFKSSADIFIFAYENDSWTKLYKPLAEKKNKFQYLGSKESNFIFGWNQLPEKGDKIFITGGEKDVLSLASKGFNAISLNSETAKIETDTVSSLKKRFNDIIVLYDTDETGIKQSQILANTHGFSRMVLPSMLDNGKDISDYFSKNSNVDEFKEVLNNSLEIFKSQNEETKSIYNAVELLALGNLEPDYLMAPILPRKGTAVVAGKPDTGKSQYVRQLCIHVANGIPKFLGFDLNIKHQSAIYVATEDGLEATSFLLNKQLEGLNTTPNENLRFMIADTLEQEEILSNLDIELTKKKADLVIVDSFGDIFKGGDSNNNMAMRNTVKLFDKIAKKHDCLIMFVHHINKGAYRQSPGQEHIQGGAGLMQKVRLGIQLSEGDGNTRYFTVVKGNYCPKEYKENTIVLEFTETNFLFRNTGNMILTSSINKQDDKERQEEKFNDLFEKAQAIFKNRVLSASKFVKMYCDMTNKSIPTAKRALKHMKESEIVVSCNGGYRFNSDSLNSSDEDESNDINEDFEDDIDF